MSQSREDFLRSLGITNDDTRNPDEIPTRTALRTQKGNSSTASMMSGGGGPSASSSGGYSRPKPSTVAPTTSSTSYSSMRDEQQPSPISSSSMHGRAGGAGGYAGGSSSSSTSSPAYEQPTAPMMTPPPAAAAPSSSLGGGGGGGASSSKNSAARSEFLRSLGIDNAGEGGASASASGNNNAVPSRASAASMSAASASPSMGGAGATRASVVKNAIRRSEYMAQEEEAESPSTMNYGPRGGSTANVPPGASNRRGATDSPTIDNSASVNYNRRELERANSGARATAGLDSSMSSTRHSLNSSLPRAGSGLDSSMSGGGLSSSVSSAPLLDIAGRQVPADATADDLKKHGNAFYEAGDFRKAVRFYTRAIEKNPASPEVLYSNRSAAYLLASKQMALDTRNMALRDAEKCIQIKPQWFKGYSRKGDALFKLERFEEACDAYREALSRDPSNAAIQSSLEQCKSCCMPQKRDTSFAGWSQPRDPMASTAGGRSMDRSGASSLNASTKSAHELLDEFHVAAQRATGNSTNPSDYRARELEKFRSGRGMRTSTASGGSGDGNNSSMYSEHNSSSASVGGGNNSNDASFSSMSGGSASTLASGAFGSDAAAAYQNSMLEAYRRKKAMKEGQR